MKNNILKTVTLGLGLITFSSVNAQEAPKNKEAKFEKIDTNKDGQLSLEEFANYREAIREKNEKEPAKGDYSKRFKQIDTDQNGFLSKEEFKNRKDSKVEKMK